MVERTDRFQEIDGGFFADPYTVYRDWSRRGGVHHVRFPDGRTGWVVTGYEAGKAALADDRLRKSGANARWFAAGQNGAAPQGPPRNTHMLDSDPPDHTRLRKLVNKAFTTRAVTALRPRIEEITSGLLDDMAAHDQVDLMDAFAVPLPLTVIGEVLGVSAGDRAEFRRLAGALSTAAGDRTAVQDLKAFLAGLVRDKRERPAGDLLSALVQARDDDDRLDEQELVAMAFLLLFAGQETTVNLIGNGALALLRDPAQLQALRSDPALIPSAVEELLRFDGPVCFTTLRYTAEPVTIDGTPIPEGEFVHIALGGANRDPRKFPDPDRLDLTRPSAGHIAFGHGIHYCVGAPLARLEAEIAFTRLLDRFPRLALAGETGTRRWQESFRIRGLHSLPVTLT